MPVELIEPMPTLLVPQVQPVHPSPFLSKPVRDTTPELTSPCLREDPELWFAESPNDVERAKTFCQPCPVRERCLADAIERAEPWGVWGGELLLRGVVVPRKRPRGRPRKHPLSESTPAPAA